MKKIYLSLIISLLWANSAVWSQAKNDLYDLNHLHDIRIQFAEKNWSDILDSLRLLGDDMLLGKITIDGNGFDNVGIGYAKTQTYQTGARRNALIIKLNYIDKKQNYQGVKTLHLSNALRDPSLVREVLGYEMARQYMVAPRANYTNVSINGDNRGIFINVEAIGEDFLTQHFGDNQGAFFRCMPDTRSEAPTDCERNYGALRFEGNATCYLRNFDMLSKEGWDDLIEMTRVLNNTPEKIGTVLNVDATLWYLALNNVIVNLNSYTGQYSTNFYLYKDKNGLFSLIPTELHLSFGSLKSVSAASDLDFNALVNLDPLLHLDNGQKPLIAQLLRNPDYKKIYTSHIRQILADWFDKDQFKAKAEAYQALISLAYSSDANKPYSMADFQRSLTETVGQVTKIPGLVDLMQKRTRFLKKTEDLLVVPPQISNINYSNRQRFSTKGVTEFHIKAKIDHFPKRVRVFYRPLGSNGAFTEVTMLDDGKSHDGNAGDKTFGTVINPAGQFKAIEYYIMAENANAVTYEPALYMNQRLKVSLDELNK